MKNHKTRFECFNHLDGTLCENLPWYKKYHDSKFVNIVHSLFLLVFLFGILGGISYTAFMADAGTARAANKIWIGLGDDLSCGGNVGDGLKWSCGDNWSGGTVPTASDWVTFDASSSKDSVVDADFHGTIVGIATSDDAGTITMERNLAITGNFYMEGGTFNSGANVLDVSGSFQLLGGTFNAPSTNLFLGGNATFGSLANFNHNSGTVVLTLPSAQGINCNGSSTIFNLVDLSYPQNFYSLTISNCNIPLGDNPTIGFAISLHNSSINGTGVLNSLSSGYISIYQDSQLNGFSGFQGAGNLTIHDVGGSHDFSSYSPFVVRDLRLEDGIVTLPNNAYINRTLNIAPTSSGSVDLIAPSGNLYLLGTTYFSQDAIFNHNNGTIIISGSLTGSINCDETVFNALDLSVAGSGTKTFHNCNLPLGNNPAINIPVILHTNSNAFGTGSINSSTLLTLLNNSTLTGFSGISSQGLSVNNGILNNFSSYSLFDIGATTAASGTNTHLALPNNAKVCNLNIGNDTIFTAPSGIFNISCDLIIGSGATFNHSNGKIATIPHTSSLHPNWLCGDKTFNLVDLSSGNSWHNFYNCNFELEDNPTIYTSARFYTGNTITGSGTLTLDRGAVIADNTVLSGFSGLISNGASLSIYSGGQLVDSENFSPFVAASLYVAAGGELDLPNNAVISILDIDNTGTVNGPTGEIFINSSFVVSGDSTFNHGNGTVVLGGNYQLIDGDIAFFNLSKTNPGTLIFENASTTTVLGELKLQGQQDNLLVLKSSTNGNQWNIDPQGTRSISYADVKDSNNINPTAIITTNSLDSGNNINWQFPQPPVDPEEPEEPTEPTDPEEPTNPTTPTTPPKEEKPTTEKPKPTDPNKPGENNEEKPETPEENPETPAQPETPTENPDNQTDDTKSAQYSWWWLLLILLLIALIIWAIKREHDDEKNKLQ